MPQRLKPGFGLGRQLQPPGRAAEQHRAERVFKRADLLTHRRRRHGQLVRRAGEGKVPGRRVQNAQAVQGEMRPLHACTAGATRGKRGMAMSNIEPSSPIIR